MSDVTPVVNGQAWHEGIPCGCSSPNGHYVLKYAVQTALEAGWEDEDAEEAVASYDDAYFLEEWAYADSWFDIVEDAENWLQSVTVNGYWLFTDGDFRLVAVTECEECAKTVDADSECPEHVGWLDVD